jgi:hypothetical protein
VFFDVFSAFIGIFSVFGVFSAFFDVFSAFFQRFPSADAKSDKSGRLSLSKVQPEEEVKKTGREPIRRKKGRW